MQNSIEKNKNKSSALWKNVNQICNKTKQKTVVEKIKIPNSEILTDPYQMANKFNDFFCDIGKILAPWNTMKS